MRGWLVRRPLMLWVAYVTAILLVAVTANATFPSLMSGAEGLSALQVAMQAPLTLLPLPLAAYVGWRSIGFVRPRHLAVASFPLTTVLFGYLAPWRDQDVTKVLLAVTLVVLVAVGEEITFRGLVLPGLLARHRVGAAVVMSSALFGMTHLVNLVLGAQLPEVVLQVVFSGLGGAGYAALRLRTGSLWPPLVLHAAYDLTFRLVMIEGGTAFANTVYMAHGVGWAAFAYLVLRRPHPRAAERFRTEPLTQAVDV
jgi:uncharacterized protein